MNFLNVMAITADILGILGAVFAFLAWIQTIRIRQENRKEQQRQARRVTVNIRHGARQLELPIELRREDLTRAEVLGRIGMIPMREEGKRFSIKHLSTAEFLQQINQIGEGTGDAVLIIPCTEEEFAQFDLSSHT